jgi:hypothetical protein
MNEVAYNYKAILFYGILLIIAAITILYFLKTEPFYRLVNSGISWVSVNISKVGTGNIGKLISDNWVTIASFGAMVVPLIYTTVKGQLTIATKNKEIQTAKELSDLAQTTSEKTITQVKGASATQIQDLKDKLSQYENDPALGMLQNSYSQIQTEKAQLQGQITMLQQQLEAEIQKRPVITKTLVK